MKNISFKIVATSLVAVLSFTACSSEDGQQNAQQQQPAVPVDFFQIEDKPAITSKGYPSLIKPYNEVEIQARVQGVLKEKLFNEGDYIKKGSILYTIEDDTYKANLDQAKANFTKAEKDYTRAVVLLDTKSISDQAYDQYRFVYDDAKAKLEQAQIEFDYTKVLAPIDGIAGIKQHDVGNLVGSNSTNTTLVTITQINPVHAEFSLDKTDVSTYLSQLRSDDAKVVLKKGDKVYEGKVDYISPKLDVNTDTLLLRVKIDNKKRELIVGEFVELTVENINLGNVFLIPEVALVKTSALTFVYVIDANNTAQVRPVQVGMLTKHGVAVKKDSLKAGDKIIVSNIAKVRPNSKVMQMPKAEATQKVN